MRKILIILSLLTLVTGCSIVHIENQTYEEIVSSILGVNQNLKNVSLEGYLTPSFTKK